MMIELNELVKQTMCKYMFTHEHNIDVIFLLFQFIESNCPLTFV